MDEFVEEEGYVQCPVCGSALEPVIMQQGVYDCPNCGEVEEDEDGFIVNGRFFKIDPAGREGFGELNTDDDENDFGDSEDESIGKALVGLDLEIDGINDIDDDDVGELGDLDDVGFTPDVTNDDMEEHTI